MEVRVLEMEVRVLKIKVLEMLVLRNPKMKVRLLILTICFVRMHVIMKNNKKRIPTK